MHCLKNIFTFITLKLPVCVIISCVSSSLLTYNYFFKNKFHSKHAAKMSRKCSQCHRKTGILSTMATYFWNWIALLLSDSHFCHLCVCWHCHVLFFASFLLASSSFCPSLPPFPHNSIAPLQPLFPRSFPFSPGPIGFLHFLLSLCGHMRQAAFFSSIPLFFPFLKAATQLAKNSQESTKSRWTTASGQPATTR